MSTTQTLEQVRERKQELLKGDPSAMEKQAKAGKLGARQRIEKLLDAGSFVELGQLVAQDGQLQGVITGYGTVDERPVCIFSQDFTVRGGAMNQGQAAKIVRLLEMARKTGAPVLALLDSAGARVDEGAGALEGYAEVFAQMTMLSGVVPMLAFVLGPCVGGAAMMSQLMDFTFMVKGIGQLMSHGPQVIASTFTQDWTPEEIGGAEAMLNQGGASFVEENEETCFVRGRQLLSYLPSNNLEDSPLAQADDMNRLLPAFNAGQDHRELLVSLSDAESFLEVGKGYTDRVGGLARLGGMTVMLVATGGGELCARGATKLARMVRFADCYNIPVVTLIDTDGFRVMEPKHQMVMLKASSQLLYAFASATCPKLCLITGNAIGAAYVALGGKANADVRYAWPGAVISPLMPEAAIQVLNKKEIESSSGDAVQARQQLADKYASDVADGIHAAEAGLIDDVIEPAESRQRLIAALQMVASKRDSNPPKKHGNIPL